MFTNAARTFLSKPILANSALKSSLLYSKAPFQAAILKRSFARHSKVERTTTNISSNTTDSQFHPAAKPIATGPNVDQIIREDLNLNNFMSKIYRTTGFSIAGCLGLSYLLAGSTAVAASPMVAMIGGFAMSIGGIIAIQKIAPQITLEKGPDNQMIEKWTNPTSRQLAFSSIITGSGIMLSPFMQGLLFVNPAIIPMAAGLSIFTMGGASLYAMYKPLGHFKAWESTLYSTLLGMIGMNVVSLILTACIGPNVFSMACGRVDMYLGLALFTAFQAVDTQIAVQAYKEGNYDHLMHVVSFFLNFKNIFIRIASIMANFRND